MHFNRLPRLTRDWTADRYASVVSWSAAGAIYHLILSEIVPFYEQFYDEDGDIAMVLGQCTEGLEQCLVEGEPDAATHQMWLKVLLEAELKDIQMGGIDLAYPARQMLLEQATDEEWRWIEKRVREKITSLRGPFSIWERESLVNLLVKRLTNSRREAEVTDLILELGSEKQKWGLLIEISLEEGDVPRALELLPLQPWSYDLKVAQAAEMGQPQAAIEIYRRRVVALIERRGRDNYQNAAAILQRVKELYNLQGKKVEWDRLMTRLRQRHARLLALMDELNKAAL